MNNENYFHLEGEFLGVCAIDGYKLKYLRLRTAERDVIIKVPKELRMGLVYQLAIGDRLRCEGIQKDGKFKASTIEKVVCVAVPAENHSARLARCSVGEATSAEAEATPPNTLSTSMPTLVAPENEPKVKILICQKSHCHNNGGKEIYSALVEQLNSHNLNDSVTLKSTGCLKYCKQAPNLVVLPARTAAKAETSGLKPQSSYRNVRLSQISAIISNVRYLLSQ